MGTPEDAGYAIGQKLDVKCLGKNEKNQIRLSRRQVLLREAAAPAAISSGLTNEVESSSPVTATANATIKT